MRITFSLLAALAVLLGQAAGAPNGPVGQTAMQALKLLPKDSLPRLARVQAFDGGPSPERWHILVHDTREENGLHEYVVAKGELVASRAVSQFAEELKADDIIGSDAVKFDSDKAAAIARLFAEVNKQVMASCNYELKKDSDGAAALWNVTALDKKGDELGKVTVSANEGKVVRHEGFVIEPPAYDVKALEAIRIKKEMAALRAQQARKAAAASAAANMGLRPAPDGWVGDEPSAPRQGFFQRAGGSVGRMFGGGR